MVDNLVEEKLNRAKKKSQRLITESLWVHDMMIKQEGTLRQRQNKIIKQAVQIFIILFMLIQVLPYVAWYIADPYEVVIDYEIVLIWIGLISVVIIIATFLALPTKKRDKKRREKGKRILEKAHDDVAEEVSRVLQENESNKLR